MKRIAGIILLCLPLLLGQTVVYVNSAVVAWDAVTTLVDGSPVPPSEISYEVVIARPGNTQNFTTLGVTSIPAFTVSLVQEGDWLVGVRAIRTVGTEILLSSFLWSDGTTNPFVLRYYKGPAVPTGLRLQ